MQVQDDERRKELVAHWPPVLKNLLKRAPGADKFARLLDFVPWQPGHREHLLEILPKNSVCAEVGVHRGEFSARVLQIVNPKELHLIDPWKYEPSDTYKDALYGGKASRGQAEMDDRCQSLCVSVLKRKSAPNALSYTETFRTRSSLNFQIAISIGFTSTATTSMNSSGKTWRFPSRRQSLAAT
jgi:hypothetical protein